MEFGWLQSSESVRGGGREREGGAKGEGLALIRSGKTGRYGNDSLAGRSVYSRVPRKRGQATQDRVGKHRGQSGGTGSEGIMWARAFVVVSVRRQGKAGRAGSGLAGVNNFSRLWDTGAFSSYLPWGD